MSLQDMTNAHIIYEIGEEIYKLGYAGNWTRLVDELYRRSGGVDYPLGVLRDTKRLYDVYDVRIKSKQIEFTWDMIYPIPVRGESKRSAAQSVKNTHLLAIQTDALIMVTERGMNTSTGEKIFTMSDLD
jgi:CTP synthase (UTP-ammonia lyase)